MEPASILISSLSKIYTLGQVGAGTLYADLNRFASKVLGKEDPYSKLAELNDKTRLSKTGVVKVLDSISLRVNKGEIVGVIGKNGAGKSTLLKILSRITTPTSGTADLAGSVSALLEVGTGMHFEMTAKQNIYLNGTILGMSRKEIKSKIDAIVEFAGVQKYIDTPIKRFSSGMQVRLAFAIAAFLEPDILIVDEVLAVGDVEFQKRAVGKIREVSTGGNRTVILVSHDMRIIKSICDRGIVLEKGRLVYDGAIDKAISYYLENSNREISYAFEGVSKVESHIQRVTLVDVNNSESSIFAHDEGFNIIVDIGNYSSLPEGCCLLVSVLDQYKNVIGSCQSNNVFEHNRIKVLGNQLVRGQYSLQLILLTPYVKQYHNIFDVCSFEIYDTGSVLSIHRNYNYGTFFLSATWQAIDESNT